MSFADGRPIDPVQLASMNRTLTHRGPDDEGYHLDAGIGLGHRRLSIIDLAGGHQPLYNEDGTVCVVFNGEVYNYPALQQDLEARGHAFRTRSDTEVLVHLYEERGEDMAEALSGMFAFGLWDARDRTLLLVRDRMGKKPLYYAEVPHGIVFASALKTILASGLIDRGIDPDGLSDFLSLNYTLAPLTVVKGVRQLPAGHLLVWRDGRTRVRPYWDVTTSADGEPRTDVPEGVYEDELRGLLRDAVTRRLMSEVPLGVLLSGGIDSSTVVAFMAQHSPEPVKTFSIGFREKSYDELAYTRLVAATFRTEHHELLVESNMLDVLPDLIWHLDEPFGDASAIPMYHLARFARSTVTVALSGDGADELFGGYPTLQADQLAVRYRRLPGWVRRLVAGGVARLPVSFNKVSFDFKARQFVAGVEHDMAEWHYWWRLITTEAEQAALLNPDVRRACIESSPCARFVSSFNAAPIPDWPSRLMYVDLKTWLANDILTKADRTTMAHALELRSPFLDHRVVEFASRLPFRLKVRRGETKYLLKRTMASMLPRQIVYRKKKGFNTPISIWFRGPLKDLLIETLSPQALSQHDVFNPQAVARLIAEHLEGTRDHGLRLWGLLCFQLWHERFLATAPVAQGEAPPRPYIVKSH
ncbi:MAG: asparagine synthase (glutamine-hydrolyzing) [Candidatus Latescibacteria bacterium]|nr:asparagine synthase (glutamine-hydrolyzing) [Candidatus Latescibacterota bacterium]